jgi:hypothetical protein
MTMKWEGIVYREKWDLFDGIGVGESLIMAWFDAKEEYEQLQGKKVRVTLEVIE